MIDVNKILQSDVLDIIFDGRNKAYGAYELRTNYARRLYISVISMVLACVFLFLLYSFTFGSGDKPAKQYIVADAQLQDLKKEEPEPPVVEPPKQKPVEVEVKQFTPPVITRDEEVKPDEAPPEIDSLKDTKIGTINREGEKDDGIVAPPNDDGKGVIEAPVRKDETDWEQTFVSVQIESQYPGGIESWKRFLLKTLRYPNDAIENNVSGTVIVQFIVDKEGVVSDVEAISGPEELKLEAVRVIKKSGKWIPAVQNGRQVKSWKKQPVVFRLDQD
ncbi:MAG TPA: TonB family protein [Chitinophagaceae bacterium]|nr:TonB family protein [Chitinophagaceae bacterium]